jgi:hypothetical protein
MPYLIEASTEIAYRHDFAILCNARNYKDAVEVGVDLGIFAKSFLDRFNGHWLMLVDPYGSVEEFPYDRSLDAATALQALAGHHGRFRFVCERSPEAIQSVMRFIKAPEFVYIDGSHDKADVAEDLREWWKVIPDHGMMAGHDFDEGHPGVMEAVREFAQARHLVVRVTHEVEMPSWYCYKKEPDSLCQRLYLEGDRRNPHHTKDQLF